MSTWPDEELSLPMPPSVAVLRAWGLAVLAAIGALAILLFSFAHGAPRPGPRRVRDLGPRDYAGQWAMIWSGVPYRLTLRADGSSHAETECNEWVGAWCIGPGSQLRVRDTTKSELFLSEEAKEWTVTWERGRDGLLDPTRLKGVGSYGDGSLNTVFMEKQPCAECGNNRRGSAPLRPR